MGDVQLREQCHQEIACPFREINHKNSGARGRKIPDVKNSLIYRVSYRLTQST